MEEIKGISEERRFRNDAELIMFIETMNGHTWEQMTETCLFLSKYRPEAGRNYWEMYMNIDRNFLIIGGFMVRISRCNLKRSTGNYTINVSTCRQVDRMNHNEKKRLFKL